MKTKNKRIKIGDWFSCPFGNDIEGWTAEVHLSKRKGQNKWYISIWGEDDFGIHTEEKFNQVEGLELFNKIKDNITEKELRALGFTNA